MSKFLNKSGKLVDFTTVEEFIAFIASGENTNMDLKKGIANIANLELATEKLLIETGNKDIVKDVISRLFSAGGIDTDGNIIVDDNDLEIYQALFGSPFDLNNTKEEDNNLLLAINEKGWNFKYIQNGERSVGVYDIEGNLKGIEESFKYDVDGNKIPLMVANPVSETEWLASDTSVTDADYNAYIDTYVTDNALMNLNDWLASDTSVTDADYDTYLNDFVTINTLFSEEDYLKTDVLPENQTDELYQAYLNTYAIDNTLQTETEFLIAGSTNAAADYEVNYVEITAVANGLQNIATWTADEAKVDSTYLEYVQAAAIPGFLSEEEWIADGYTSDTQGYYDYIVANGAMLKNAWVISLSTLTTEDYILYIVSNGAKTKNTYFIENTNLIAEDYTDYVLANGADTKVTFFVANTNLLAENYEAVIQDSDEDGLKYEVDTLDFTVYNTLCLVHIAGTIAEETQELYDNVYKELVIAILDNPNSPEEFITPFLGSDDIDLLNKALVHPNTDITTRFEELKAIGTEGAYPKSIKLQFISAVVNKAQYIKSSTVLAHYINADVTTGTQAEINEKKALKKEAAKTLLRIAAKEFMDNSGLPEVEIISDETIDSIVDKITITL